jgi:hypothetical protein
MATTRHPQPRTGTARLSPQSRAIVEYLQANGKQTFDQLHMLFKEPSHHRNNGDRGHIPNPDWLRTRLYYMREAGHVKRVLDQGGWFFEAGYPAGAAPEPRQRDKETALPQAGNVTPPRRIYVMGGETYKPPRPTATRQGSMDFADCPSVEAGRARPFIPGKVIHG